MKNLQFLVLALATVLLSGHGAFALSTETHSTVNGNSSSNFSDPDDQTPPGLAMSDPDGANSSVSSRVPNVNAPSIQQRMGVNQGQQQFDNAYNHVSNQH